MKRDKKTGLFVSRAGRRKNPAELVILGANPHRRQRNPAELVLLGNPGRKKKRNGSAADELPDDEKATHASVAFEHPSRHEGQKCGGCAHYIAGDPARCQKVQPPITSPDWCAMYQFRFAKNPAADYAPTSAGVDLYKDFHGRAPKEVLEVSELQGMPREAVVLGDLVELHVEAPHGLAAIKFDGDGVKLAANAARDELFIVGGRQNIERFLETLGVKRSDGVVRLGKVPYIVYETRKGMDGFHLNKYEHYLGEEDGKKPTAYYDPEIERITLRGGNYRIEAPGIIN